MIWKNFVYRARDVGYPSAKDSNGIEIVGIPGGYIAPATDGPAGPRVEVVQERASIVYDMPTLRDVAAFLRRVAPR